MFLSTADGSAARLQLVPAKMETCPSALYASGRSAGLLQVFCHVSSRGGESALVGLGRTCYQGLPPVVRLLFPAMQESQKAPGAPDATQIRPGNFVGWFVGKNIGASVSGRSASNFRTNSPVQHDICGMKIPDPMLR